jgi:hypothetical protein
LLDRLDRRTVLDLGRDVDGAEGLDRVAAGFGILRLEASPEERRDGGEENEKTP